jgi:hypothetical protein
MRGNQQEDQGEMRQWFEEAYWLSLDRDPAYLAWLTYEHARLKALIQEQDNGNV